MIQAGETVRLTDGTPDSSPSSRSSDGIAGKQHAGIYAEAGNSFSNTNLPTR